MRRSCHLFRTSCAPPFGPCIRTFKVLLHFSIPHILCSTLQAVRSFKVLLHFSAFSFYIGVRDQSNNSLSSIEKPNQTVEDNQLLNQQLMSHNVSNYSIRLYSSQILFTEKQEIG